MQIQVYLDFDGRCEEAIEFYRATLGAQVPRILRFKDSPEPHSPDMNPPIPGDKIMHSTLQIGETTIMASDGRNSGNPSFRGFWLSLPMKDSAEASRIFDLLGYGGQVVMPLAKTFFSPLFGMVTDKFGVGWMVMVGH